MRDPSRKKEKRIRPRHVRGLKSQRVSVHEVARVIEQHDDHHEAPQQIDRVDPRSRRGLRGGQLASTSRGRTDRRVEHAAPESATEAPDARSIS